MSLFSRRTMLTASSFGLLMAAQKTAPALAADTQTSTAHEGTFTFPKDFIWGAATAGHQVEGNNINSDMWLLEHLKPTPFKESSGDACDHYHLYEQDIALLAKLGLKAFRFSLEWARIEPAKGEFSAAEMRHYVQVAQCCLNHGVKPVITYNHYSIWSPASAAMPPRPSANTPPSPPPSTNPNSASCSTGCCPPSFSPACTNP